MSPDLQVELVVEVVVRGAAVPASLWFLRRVSRLVLTKCDLPVPDDAVLNELICDLAEFHGVAIMPRIAPSFPINTSMAVWAAYVATVEKAGPLPEQMEYLPRYVAQWFALMRAHDGTIAGLTDAQLNALLKGKQAKFAKLAKAKSPFS